MKYFVSTFAAALMLTTPVLATSDCQELCDPVFYQTATADAVQQLIDNGADVNARGGDDKSPEAGAIDKLVAARHTARAARDFAKADLIRDLLTEAGITVEDTPRGPRWEIG